MENKICIIINQPEIIGLISFPKNICFGEKLVLKGLSQEDQKKIKNLFFKLGLCIIESEEEESIRLLKNGIFSVNWKDSENYPGFQTYVIIKNQKKLIIEDEK